MGRVAVPHPERELGRLQKEIAKGPPPVVVISGPSAFFRGEAVEAVLAAIPASADLRRIDGTEKTDGREIDDLRGGGLFGSGTWVCVRRGDGWIGQHGEELAPVLSRIGAGCGLLLEVQKLDKRKRVTKELAAVGFTGEFRDLYAEPYDRSRSPLEAELVGWVAQRARRHGTQLTPEAAFLLVSTVGKDPSELVAELVRLGDVLPRSGALGPEDLRPHLTVAFESTPFEFAEAVLAHDRRRAERSLDAMFARGVRARDGSGMDAGGIFPFVTSWLWQSMMNVHRGTALREEGMRTDQIAGRVGVRTFVDRFVAQVEANPESRLRRGLLLVLDAQRELRQSGEEPRSILERFLARYFREGAA
jgi:DNA polymerase III delta subunit